MVDDEDKIRSLLKRMISFEGYTVYEAPDLKTAAKILTEEEIEVVVCDVKLPDGSGLDLTRAIKSSNPKVEILLLTAHAEIQDAVEGMRSGAFDYTTKGNDNDKLLSNIAQAMDKALFQRKVSQLQAQVALAFGWNQILGQSSAIRETLWIAQRVAVADTTVLLLGETGTGKELFARAIHAASPRATQSFIALNCSALSKDLLESELFGHQAGAFTGAIRAKRGLIEEAAGGTLFLDEIGELPGDLQAKLLRLLETGQFFKIGNTVPTEANVRIISATNRHLPTEVDEGKFRRDLFYRLNLFTIEIPPLRDRKKDIPILANHYVKIFAEKLNKSQPVINKELLRLLESQIWKGNIRELKNVIERAMILSDTPELGPESLPFEFREPTPTSPRLSVFELASVEKQHILQVLNYTHGNKVEAARLLDVGLTTIYRKIEEYGLK